MIAYCYYRFADEAHADAMIASIADEPGYQITRLGPRVDTVTGAGTDAVYTFKPEYIVGVVAVDGSSVGDWDEWLIPSEAVPHTWAGMADEQAVYDSLATADPDAETIPETVPTRREQSEALQALRAERTAAYNVVLSVRAERDKTVRQVERLTASRDAAQTRRTEKVNAVTAILASLSTLRDDRDAQVAIAADTSKTGAERAAARDQRDALNAQIATESTERDLLIAERDGLVAFITDANAEIASLATLRASLNADLVAKRNALVSIVADIKSRIEALNP